MGIDLGKKRIGIAMSDATGILASPWGVIERSGEVALDHAEIKRVASDNDVEVIVVGIPVSMDGVERAVAINSRSEAAAIGEIVGIPVRTCDERLSTVEAARNLQQAGRSTRQTRKPKAKSRTSIDASAAAVILQGWLETIHDGRGY